MSEAPTILDYIDLRDELELIRKRRGGEESEEEDRHLEMMDGMWHALSSNDRSWLTCDAIRESKRSLT